MADDKPAPPGGASNVPPGLVPPGAIAATPLNFPPISLDGSKPPPLPTTPTVAKKPDTDVKDTFRELIETIVFVVVLVLMLKTFLAEAFVIPTGSMAKTLLGYHYKVTCEQCGYVDWVNASKEGEYSGKPDDRPRLVRCQCINCKFINENANLVPVRGGPK